MKDIERAYEDMVRDRLTHDEANADSDEALAMAEEAAIGELFGREYEMWDEETELVDNDWEEQ